MAVRCLITALWLLATPLTASTFDLPPKPITQHLAPGETHRYEVALQAGDFLHVLFEQQAIDLVVTLIDPAGQRLVFDDSGTLDIPESVAVLSASGGLYRLEVRPFRSVRQAAAYGLVVRARRPATDLDRDRAAAEAATQEGHRQSGSRKVEDLRLAIEAYREARQHWQQIGEPREEARILRRLSDLHQQLGEYDAALDALGFAFEIERAASDRTGLAATLSRAGNIYRRLGQNERALGVHREALEIRLELGDPAQVARVQLDLGHTRQSMGEAQHALDHYESALASFRANGDPLREATTLASMGLLQKSLGQLDQALAGYERALDLFRILKRRDLEADTLNNLGLVLNLIGEPQAALDSYSAALDIYRQIGDERRQAAALNSVGKLLVGFGLPEAARPLMNEALERLRANADVHLESRVLLNLGSLEREVGRFDEALALFARAFDLQERAADQSGEAWTLYSQATTLAQTGRRDLAYDKARQALNRFETLGDREGQIVSAIALGKNAAALGRPEARNLLERARNSAQAVGDLQGEVDSSRELARLAQARGDLTSAQGLLEDTLNIIESLRARISGAWLRTSFFASSRQTYELAIEILMQRHAENPDADFDHQAFAVSERSRTRGLLDALALKPKPEDATFRSREKALRHELNTLAYQHRQAPSVELEARLATLLTEAHLLDGRLANTAPQPELRPTPEEIATSLSEEDVLLQFALGEPRSFLWVIADGELESFELPGRDEIETAVRDLHQQLAQPGGGRTEQRAALDALSRLALRPAFTHLGKKRWWIVPDGALHYVPFAALPVPSSSTGDSVPMMVEHEIMHLPAASFALRRQSKPRPDPQPDLRLAILADPIYEHDDPRLGHDAPSSAPRREPLVSLTTPEVELVRLPWSEREARSIAALAESEQVLLALGSEASRELAMSEELARYRVVHFASHGVLNSRFPQLSGLALSRFDEKGQEQDAFLRLHDIHALDWRAELVVLSGCRTALGPRIQGEGLIGLARGFLQAGASQVMASLWSVRDQATAELMRRFYVELLDHQKPPISALRQAQLSMWQERRWRDPYFWAAFLLVGEKTSEKNDTIHTSR